MPSRSLQQWLPRIEAGLDELEAAHRAVGGDGPGRRTATQQINYAYAMRLCSVYQALFRDLQSEGADHLASAVGQDSVGAIFRTALTQGRQLDRGNPSPSALGSDFGRLGMDLWRQLRSQDARTDGRHAKLQDLVNWRNAIAHEDFTGHQIADPRLPLWRVRSWRMACRALAVQVDAALAAHIASVAGRDPGW